MFNPAVMFALVLSAVGLASLYLSWRRPKAVYKKWLTAASWLLILLSGLLWLQAQGGEFGAVYAFTVPSLLVFICIVYNVELRQAASSPAKAGKLAEKPGGVGLKRHLVLFLLTLPIGFCVSTSITLFIINWLPWAEVNRLAFAVVALPLIWSALAYWFVASKKFTRPVIAIVISSALGLINVFYV